MCIMRFDMKFFRLISLILETPPPLQHGFGNTYYYEQTEVQRVYYKNDEIFWIHNYISYPFNIQQIDINNKL